MKHLGFISIDLTLIKFIRVGFVKHNFYSRVCPYGQNVVVDQMKFEIWKLKRFGM